MDTKKGVFPVIAAHEIIAPSYYGIITTIGGWEL